jgi:hypothetical protein
MTDEAPRQVSKTLRKLDITGYATPFYKSGQPVIFGMPGTDDLFVGVWSTDKKLKKAMRAFDISFDDIKAITDQGPFLESLCGMFRVAVDLRKEGDKVRFLEIQNAEGFAFAGAPKA